MKCVTICVLLVSISLLFPGAALSGPIDNDFVFNGLNRFGRTEAEVRNTLGEPAGVSDAKSENLFIPGGVDVVRTLEYSGVSVSVMKGANGNEYIEQVVITDNAYQFDGISIGSTKTEVTDRFGGPRFIEEDYYYYDAGAGAARFHFANDVVTKIVFLSTA